MLQMFRPKQSHQPPQKRHREPQRPPKRSGVHFTENGEKWQNGACERSQSHRTTGGHLAKRSGMMWRGPDAAGRTDPRQKPPAELIKGTCCSTHEATEKRQRAPPANPGQLMHKTCNQPENRRKWPPGRPQSQDRQDL